MGRISEWFFYLNADVNDKQIEKKLTHLSITDFLRSMKKKIIDNKSVDNEQN